MNDKTRIQVAVADGLPNKGVRLLGCEVITHDGVRVLLVHNWCQRHLASESIDDEPSRVDSGLSESALVSGRTHDLVEHSGLGEPSRAEEIRGMCDASMCAPALIQSAVWGM